MADFKKFLDQAGVSTLWSKVAEELEKKQQSITNLETTVGTHGTDINTMKGQIESLQENAYDDTEIRGLITTNTGNITKNTEAITLLNGNAETAGSVAHTATGIVATKVAEIVAGADAKFDTLKEIADWILSDTTGAAGMASDISILKNQLAGIDSTVVDEIAAEIEAALKIEGVDKYALASDLTTLAGRVKAIEDAGYQNAEQVGSAIDAKIAALDLANTYDAKGAAATAETRAKAYADGLATNYEVAGAASAAEAAAKGYSDANLATAKSYSDTNLATAKSYTDTEFAKIQALTEAEINAAIAAAQA